MTPPLPSLSASLDPIHEALDGLSHDQRVNWMRGLGRKEQKALYGLAGGRLPLGVSHFHGAEGQVIIHHGQNSLLAFNAFQKRVVLFEGRLQGYNHQTMSWFTGPGHFLLRQDGDEVLFDYNEVPPRAPEGFPPVVPNDKGLSNLVYGGMIDRVRRVSRHVVIGEAFRRGKPENAWFMLIREDAPAI